MTTNAEVGVTLQSEHRLKINLRTGLGNAGERIAENRATGCVDISQTLHGNSSHPIKYDAPTGRNEEELDAAING